MKEMIIACTTVNLLIPEHSTSNIINSKFDRDIIFFARWAHFVVVIVIAVVGIVVAMVVMIFDPPLYTFHIISALDASPPPLIQYNYHHDQVPIP